MRFPRRPKSMTPKKKKKKGRKGVPFVVMNIKTFSVERDQRSTPKDKVQSQKKKKKKKGLKGVPFVAQQ